MNQPDSQQRLRRDLRSALVRYLDTAPEGEGYPSRMAEILVLLRQYVREDRRDEFDEGLKGPTFDIQGLLVSGMAVDALAGAEGQLRALEYYRAASNASTPSEAEALRKKGQLLLRKVLEHAEEQDDIDWQHVIDEARTS